MEDKREGPEDQRPGESAAERADRNFSDLLQELRVTQTGVQILFAFLLTLVFQQRFGEVDRFGVTVYAVTVIFCVGASIFLIAPVALHRAMFQLGRKAEVVNGSAKLAKIGMALLAVALVGATLLALDMALPRWLAVTIVLGIGATLLIVWYVLPVRRVGRPARPDSTKTQ